MRRSCSRSFTVALLIVATSTARLITQDTTAGSAVTIVLDLPSPVVDKESIQLTRALLGELPGSLVRYFSFSSASIEEISAGAVHDFVGQEMTKDRTSGVTVTISEAAAIVSRNESIRDQVIQRECGDAIDRAGCGPRVNAAAIETLNELEASTETHLEALAKIVAMRFMVAREHYDQQVRVRPAYNTMPGQLFGRLKQQRVMDSEVALVQFADGIWFMARRTLTVDGKNVASESPRLELGGSEQEALTRLGNLAREGAFWNIGSIRRDINSPMLALWFLTPTVADRFTFGSAGTERVGGSLEARVVRFRETARGALLQVNGAPAPSSGRFWLARDGSVIKTELILQQPAGVGGGGRARATIPVLYEYSPRFEIWLPSTMSELYETLGASDTEFVSATARYSEYQQFQVGSRIVR